MRIHLDLPRLLWLSLLLNGCDKAAKVAGGSETERSPSHLSHVRGSAAADLPRARELVRAQLQHAMEISGPVERNTALAAAVWEALELEPDLAREAFAQLIEGSAEKNRLIEHYAMRMAEQNVEDAVQWAAALATDEDQSLAYGHIAVVLAEREPERAAGLLSDAGVAGRDFDVVVVQVIQRWAAAAPADAAAWVAGFDPGDARRAGLKTVVGVWAAADPQAVMTWIEGLTDPAVRQEGELGLGQTLREQAPGRQAEWLRLAPPELRTRLATDAKVAE